MNKTILVVAQYVGIRKIILNSLQKKGFDTLTAADSKQAEAFFDGRFINLVICDCDSAKDESYEIIKKIRNNDYYEFTPVIVISTDKKENNKDIIKELKIGGWMQKPFDVNELNFLVSQYTK